MKILAAWVVGQALMMIAVVGGAVAYFSHLDLIEMIAALALFYGGLWLIVVHGFSSPIKSGIDRIPFTGTATWHGQHGKARNQLKSVKTIT